MAEKKTSIFKNIGTFFRECKSEIKKIVWPATNLVFKNMGVVLVVITVIGLFVSLLDYAFMGVLSKIMEVSNY